MSDLESATSPEIRGTLETAAREQSVVRVARSIRRSDKIDGFVMAIGRAWVLLAVFSPGIDLNGYVALRLSDVSKVNRRGGRPTSSGARSRAR